MNESPESTKVIEIHTKLTESERERVSEVLRQVNKNNKKKNENNKIGRR